MTARPFATLPMYDLPETRAAAGRLWARLRAALMAAGLRGVPEALTHIEDAYDESWASPELYLSQICGVEVAKRFRGRLRVLATPCYAARGCSGHRYRSFVVVRADARYGALEDLAGSRLAVSSFHSHSGAGALLPLIAPLRGEGGFFGRVDVSGSHAASLAMIARGEADVAAVDCVIHALLERYRPGAVAATRILCESPPAPAPPYVAPASHGEVALGQMKAALEEAFADPDLEEVREALLLGGVVRTDEETYDSILEFGDARALERGR